MDWINLYLQLLFDLVIIWKFGLIWNCNLIEINLTITYFFPNINKYFTICFIIVKKIKVGDRSRDQPKGSHFNSYYTEMYGRALLHSPDCFILPLPYCAKQSGIDYHFWVIDMTRPGIEPQLPDHWRTLLPLCQWPGSFKSISVHV